MRFFGRRPIGPDLIRALIAVSATLLAVGLGLGLVSLFIEGRIGAVLALGGVVAIIALVGLATALGLPRDMR